MRDRDSVDHFAGETADNDVMQISSQRHSTPPTQASTAPRVVQPTAMRAERVGSSVRSMDAPAPSEMEGPPSPDQMASSLARLDQFMESAMGRLEEAVADAPEGEVTSFREAADALESGLSRLRDGIQNGTLMPHDVQRGVSNSFQNARKILDEARPTEEGDQNQAMGVSADGGVAVAPEGAIPSNMGETVRSRYQGLADSVLARVSNLEGMDDDAMKAVGDAANAFESATARLDQALFNPETGDPIDRGTFQQLYDDALSTLQSQLTDLIGGDESGSGMASMLYNAQKGVEGMNQRGFGLDVAG